MLKSVISNNVTVLKARGKPTLADVNCYCKIMSVKVLDERRLFALKMLQIHANVCGTVQLLTGFPQYNGRKLDEAVGFKCVFVFYCELELS